MRTSHKMPTWLRSIHVHLQIVVSPSWRTAPYNRQLHIHAQTTSSSRLRVARISRSLMNAQMRRMFICTVRWLLSTGGEHGDPMLVTAYGRYWRPLQLEVTICDLKILTSWRVNWRVSSHFLVECLCGDA